MSVNLLRPPLVPGGLEAHAWKSLYVALLVWTQAWCILANALPLSSRSPPPCSLEVIPFIAVK